MIIFDKKTIMNISHKIPVLFILLAVTYTNAQEKLKGNKVVSTENRDISDFSKIEVIDNVSVFLIYNESQSVIVEADSNLQTAIITEVVDGTLTIRTSEVIGRHKALNIHLKVGKNLQQINTYNNARISSNNLLTIDNLAINSFDNSSFNLKLNSKNIEIHGIKTSKLNFEILSEKLTINLEDSSNLKGIIDTKEIIITSVDKASITINGTTDLLEMDSAGNTSFKGENFEIKNAIIKSNNSASIYVNVTENLELYSNHSSQLHLFSNPEIIIHEFYDKALIRKRELKQ